MTLHQKYGRVVRVGPNEVWFNSKEAYDQIYNTCRGLEKSDFYLATSLTKPRLDWRLRPHFQDTLDLLSERDAKRYRLQRRLIGRTYHASNMAKFEAAVDGVLDRVVERLGTLQGKEIDLTDWMHIVAVECLGACVLSWSPGMLRDGTDWGTISHSYQGWRRKTVFGLFPLATKLDFCSPDFGRAFGKLWGVTYRTPQSFKAFFPEVTRRVSRRLRAALRPIPVKDDREDLLADLIQLHRDKPEFNETYLRKMAVTNFGAGHETMASTLTSVLAMIGSHAEVQAQVASEIRGAPGEKGHVAAAKLQYTRAVIKEAMRLYPVVAMSLPRKTPAGGLSIHQRWMPPNTTVGCNPVALHRNQDIYGPDAAEFNPGRWLNADVELETLRAMDRYSLNWGGGSRTCPGRHLAELVVLKAVTRMLDRYDTREPREEQPGPSDSM
ncbi:cytochrome p450 [Hirsutella rhossiliensis]|uniref:Cytochrome p450 domain-containing protein n=1 Tax=Hirsutella rhossiliensis TaxID=111463 RepID=A0A9P8N6J6_9HYPO|nr:cytochrome p450 domain-containing protein [Hirsutella rhossiliensis]KAH0967674.1 cytochrome p450 domain-containing protein [Hirsutella rhossiliensis]